MKSNAPFIKIESAYDINVNEIAVQIILGRVGNYQKFIRLITTDRFGTVTDSTIAEALRKLADSISPVN